MWLDLGAEKKIVKNVSLLLVSVFLCVGFILKLTHSGHKAVTNRFVFPFYKLSNPQRKKCLSQQCPSYCGQKQVKGQGQCDVSVPILLMPGWNLPTDE